MDSAFNQHHFSNLKCMFEGEGAIVSGNKYYGYEKMFVGGLFIIASNQLPPMSDKVHSFHNEMWLPLMSRCDLINFPVTHDGKEKFPYSVAEFAIALKHLIRRTDSNKAWASMNHLQSCRLI